MTGLKKLSEQRNNGVDTEEQQANVSQELRHQCTPPALHATPKDCELMLVMMLVMCPANTLS